MIDKLCAHISLKIPGFEIKTKDSSFIMRLLSFVLFFNKNFSERYITTSYPKVYFPRKVLNSGNVFGNLIILCHEYVHLRDRQKWGWLFNIAYLSPQIFSLLAFLAIPFSLSWLWCLLFLLPFPSPLRAYLEYRAYKMSIAVYYFNLGRLPPYEFYVEQFTSSSYYWMFPFRNYLMKEFAAYGKTLKARKYDEITLEIKNLLFPNK